MIVAMGASGFLCIVSLALSGDSVAIITCVMQGRLRVSIGVLSAMITLEGEGDVELNETMIVEEKVLIRWRDKLFKNSGQAVRGPVNVNIE